MPFLIKPLSYLMATCNECNDPVDVIIKSSDGKLHGTHSKNLELYSGGFPPASLANPDQVNTVELTESSEVVTLMLRFMHNQRQPDVDSDEMDFETINGLAEGVEKYQIYSAMQVCRTAMTNNTIECPLNVLAWATRHDYMKIADSAAPYTLGMELEVVKKELGPAIYSWICYREPYLRVIQNASINIEYACGTRCDWNRIPWTSNPLSEILRGLVDEPGQIHTLNTWGKERISGWTPMNACRWCETMSLDLCVKTWRKKGKSIPTFSTHHVGIVSK